MAAAGVTFGDHDELAFYQRTEWRITGHAALFFAVFRAFPTHALHFPSRINRGELTGVAVLIRLRLAPGCLLGGGASSFNERGGIRRKRRPFDRAVTARGGQ